MDNWSKANPRRAQEILPELIVRLILSTSTKIFNFNFPIEKGIQFSGYDGILESNEETIFFPKGKSVWEFGTDKDAVSKFRNDIDKRTTDPLGISISDTVFVFATLKIWNHRTSIESAINEKKVSTQWKDIRIFDASKIALWLEKCSGVSLWLCEEIGKHVTGVMFLDQYWKEYCCSTTPNLTSEFFLFNRDEQVKLLLTWLNEEKNYGYRVLISESSLESVLFIIATIFSISSLTGNKLKGIKDRVIIVTDAEEWNNLMARNDILDQTIFIPTFNFTEAMRCPDNISSILPVSKYSPSARITKNIETIELTTRTRASYVKALELLGYSSSDAWDIQAETKRSFLSLYRKITNIPTRRQPKWVDEENLRELIPALLLGGWNAKYSGDKKIIEILSDSSYTEHIEKLSKWTSKEDAPIFTVLDSTQLTSVRDAWSFLFDQLVSSDIDKLRKCTSEIFAATDPTFTLPKEQWFMAAVFGKSPEYSSSLQHGIVISLIMLAEKDSENNNFAIVSTNTFVYALVNEILERVSSWQHWNTIAPSLPLLAEASPMAVLEKLELEIKNNDSEFWKLFVPSEDILTGRNYYTYILWTLEKLVWDKRLAVRAIIALADICERNFEYKMTNAPSNSLYEIFCLWHPQSCLNYSERIEVIKKICISHPVSGKLLIKNLLPSGHSSCGQIQKPRWRALEEDYSPSVTIPEYHEAAAEIVTLSLETLTNSSQQWEIVFDHIKLYQDCFETLKEKCIQYCSLVEEDQVIAICDSLRAQIHKFRKFKDAEWSASEKFVSELEALLCEIEPKNIKKYKYLFSWRPSIINPIPYSKDNYDHNKESESIYKARFEAVGKIISNYGLESFISFCGTVENANDLGQIIAEKVLNNAFNFEILKKFKDINYALYASILWTLTYLNGLDALVETIISEQGLSEQEKGDALCHTPLSPTTWQKLDSFSQETTKYYWEHVRAFRLDEENKNSTSYFLEKLLEHQRPFSAVQLISYSDYDDSDMIMRILESCLQLQDHKEFCGLSFSSVEQHDVLDLFQKIYTNQNIDDLAVARLEMAYLPYFGYEGKPKCLSNYLQKNPREYVDFIVTCYKPDEPTDDVSSEDRQSQIHAAYRALELFTAIPGCNEKIMSEGIFFAWIKDASEYANQVGYRKAFERCLGKLLSHSPNGHDGIFPHEIVRSFFESNTNPDLTKAFLIEKQNQRGVHSATGGMAEKEIAQNYYNNAQTIRIAFPKTSAILERLGDSYKRESAYEQKQEMLDFRE